MSQSRQSNSAAAAGVSISPDADTLVETYAEDLMDDIFADVDRILAGDESAVYAETVTQTASDTPLFSAEPVTVPAMIVPFTAEPAVIAEPATPLTEPDTDSPQTDNEQTTSKPGQKRSWGNFLLGAVCLSTLAALGFWWMRQQPTLQTATAPAVVTTTPTGSDETAFGDYLKRSLQVIRGERSAQRDSQSATVATSPAPPAGNQPTGQPGVIERVFVPFLQPGTNPQANVNPGGSPSGAVATLPAPNTQTTGPASSSNQPGSVPSIAAVGTYELVGVLELGDRSAALFEIDGASQRVYIGETIGGSGWSIVSIDNEEVVVRRNGEVRSIYIGQQF